MKILSSILLLNVFISITTYAQLSKLEKKVAGAVDAHRTEALKLLEEVVNINSGSMNFEGVFKVS